MLEDMDGKIDGIVDGGPCAVGVESTIIDLTVTPPRLLRPGGLPLEELRAVLGEVAVDKAVTEKLGEGERPRAPGMKYRHYAPKAPVTVVTGHPARSAAYIRAHLGEKVGVICFDEFAAQFAGHTVHTLGAADDGLSHAQRVFDALRAFDGSDVSHIYAQCPDDAGLGLAVGNRLKKAAGFHVVRAEDPIVIGLTGPTGAGKTSALNALKKMGGLILDCDAIYHEMLRTDEGLRRAITDAFGDVFNENGLDRQKLGAIVFADSSAMDRLNAIIYAYIPREVERRIDETDAPIVGIDAINLFESGMDRLCHRTVGLLAPPEMRLRRIMARDGIGEEYARLRIAAQKGDDFYRLHCTDILTNDAASAAAFEIKATAFFCHIIQEIKNHKEESNHE